MNHLAFLPSVLLAQQTNSGGAAVAAGGGIFMILIFIVIAAASIFWIWMLIDCLLSSKPAFEKLIWVLVIFFLHILGAIIYFFIGRSNRSIA